MFRFMRGLKPDQLPNPSRTFLMMRGLEGGVDLWVRLFASCSRNNSSKNNVVNTLDERPMPSEGPLYS